MTKSARAVTPLVLIPLVFGAAATHTQQVVNGLPGARLVTYAESAPAFEPVLEVIGLRLDESGR